MKKLLATLVFLSVFGLSLQSSAQDATSYDLKCDLPTLQNNINLFIGELGKLREDTKATPVEVSDRLQQLANEANMLRIVCDNFSFSDTGTKLLGPIQFPAGIYRAKLMTSSSGYISGQVTVAQGECGAGNSMSALLFNAVGAANGIEALFISSGCTALIQLGLDESKWDLTFERITGT